MERWRGRNGDPKTRVQQVVDRLLVNVEAPRVLEAGCGSMSRLSAATQWHMTGIDVSMRQLERNTSLAEKVHGDLQVYRWPSRCFDLIVCWDVIEHLNDPVAAITGLAEALRPGGGLVLAFPNFWSLKGLVTKFTPFRLHAWFYRYILGDRRRIEELDQFPTPFRLAISPARIVALGRRLGLTTVLDEHYEGPVQTHMRARSRLADIAFACLGWGSRLVTGGRLDLGLSDCVVILQRTGER